MKTVVIDFDGVIHKYSQGWRDGTIYDEPIEGAFEAIKQLQKKYAVVIQSTRLPEQIAFWLAAWNKHHDLTYCIDTGSSTFWHDNSVILITNRKIPAEVYIDDRAYLFKSWDEVLTDFGVDNGKS